MSLFCPTCDAVFTGTLACPRCGGRLVTPGEAPIVSGGRKVARPDPIHPTPVVRVAVGVVAALGLYFGAQEWTAAAVAAGGGSPTAWRASDEGRVAGYAGAVLAAVVGGLLAGAGRPSGLVTGAVAGAACGAVPLLAENTPDRPPSGSAYLAAAVCVGAAGAAGIVGGRVWPAVQDYVVRPGAGGSRGSSILGIGGQKGALDDEGRPTAWVRATVATVLVVAAVGEAERVRTLIRTHAGHALNVGTVKPDPVVCLQIAGFLTAVAGIFGGASTGAGLRHGLMVAGGATIGVLGLTSYRGELPPAVDGLLRLWDYPDTLSDPYSVMALGVTLAGMCGLAGWFGGMLLPPLAPKRERLRDYSGTTFG